MEEIVRSLPDQIQEGVRLSRRRIRRPSGLIISGMGGSGIAGEVFKAVYQSKIDLPILTHHGYGLPDFIPSGSLVILISYSGNTEEVLSGLEVVKQRRLNAVAITSGGRLSSSRLPVITIPGGLPPRGALGYLFTPLPLIAYWAGLIRDPTQALIRTAGNLRRWYPAMNRKAIEVAKRVRGRFPIIYTSNPRLYPIAYRWVCQFNENAKIFAHCHYLPELDHNEIVGLGGLRKVARRSVLIVLRDREKERGVKRIRVTRKIVGQDFEDVIEISVGADDLLTRYLKLIWLGDMVSVRLSRMEGVDPFRIERIDRLKEEMRR
ncbi:bifunctional phosphoglucose/phosphomannose isomerase [candidate division WOR-3 bacterium]|uniref:Bifunctional phosphoglucose/phosphomannose isomerase n=1 Tax=candidate division WOR-3 bacterium TaxID=2052148 RepID=A0A660SE30_UNCW3|nr:MAG: bifunctional phosphoglucose/phosphomannose isomerase [candidate division WOR-3 bacterium]